MLANHISLTDVTRSLASAHFSAFELGRELARENSVQSPLNLGPHVQNSGRSKIQPLLPCQAVCPSR